MNLVSATHTPGHLGALSAQTPTPTPTYRSETCDAKRRQSQGWRSKLITEGHDLAPLQAFLAHKKISYERGASVLAKGHDVAPLLARVRTGTTKSGGLRGTNHVHHGKHKSLSETDGSKSAGRAQTGHPRFERALSCLAF